MKNNFETVRTVEVYVPRNRNAKYLTDLDIVKNDCGRFGIFEPVDQTLILPCEYDRIEPIGNNATFLLTQGNKNGLCDFVSYHSHGAELNFNTGCWADTIEFNTDGGTDVFALRSEDCLYLYVPHLLYWTEQCERFVITNGHLVTFDDEGNVYEVICLYDTCKACN